MRPRLPVGLRGRLLLAFMATSALSLAVVAAVMLGPLRSQLREQSIDNLQNAVLGARPDFQTAVGTAPADRELAVRVAATNLTQAIDARILVDSGDDGAQLPDFFYDTAVGPSNRDAVLAALEALREQRTIVREDGDRVTVAARLFTPDDAVIVAQRRLTEVATAVDQVRNALVAAAAGGLLVALALAVALTGTLLRRLARLRTAALRITAEGPDAPPTPRDANRDEVGDLARALARMQEELRRQETARRAFVATASHELRTPLTMLQGTMELLEEDLRDGVDVPDAQVQVANARRELRRLSALSGELLDLSRLDAAVQLRSEPVELGELARAVAAEFHLRAREADVRIAVEPPAEGCWSRADPDAVARVVRILLDNALRYGPPGGVVHVRTACDGQAALEVADAGPGIPPDERERVFERFHRGRAATAEGGFGLGLAIGRELAERMGGALRLAGGDEPGACFVLSLPSADAGGTPRRRPRDAVARSAP